jgi:radical SAM-linked protein
LNAFKLGCKFDGWSEQFDYDRWIKAFKMSQIDPVFYAQRNIPNYELFPWDLIDIGVKKEYLLKEYLRSKQEFIEDDCRKGKCLVCGLEKTCLTIKKIEKSDVKDYTIALDTAQTKKPIEKDSVTFKYRVQFTKIGTIRFLSHAEVSVLIIRILRRAHMPVYYSKGFHPRPKVSFDFALPVGMESKSEFFDVILTEDLDSEFIRKMLDSQTPKGMEICLVTKIPLNSKPLPLSANKIFFTILIERPKVVPSLDLFFHEQRLAKFLSLDKINLKGSSENSFKEASFTRWFDKIIIQSLTPNSLILELVAKVHQGKLISPHKVLETLYPELKYSKGNYRMVKEATSYV